MVLTIHQRNQPQYEDNNTETNNSMLSPNRIGFLLSAGIGLWLISNYALSDEKKKQE